MVRLPYHEGRTRRLVVALLVAVLALGCAAPVAPVLAQGIFQQRQQQAPPQQHRRTLFDLLFGPREQPRQVAPQAPVQRQPSRPRRATRPAPPPPPAKPKVPKSADATRVLVIGDSLAGEVADALVRLYAEDPDIAVNDKSVAASGIVRSDFFDWNSALAEAIADESFDVLVVFIGANDRQDIEADGATLKPPTDEWATAYRARLVRLLDQLRAAGKPVIWLGLPPMQAPTYSAAIARISGIQRLAAFASGADFIDIYDRFLDDDGNYTAYGPDISGQQVRIRNSDGIHFTDAGADKLAFYVGQALKLFTRGAGPAVTDPLAGTDAAALLRLPYQGLGEIRLLQVAGAVVSLTNSPTRADQLVTAGPPGALKPSFSLDDLVKAPIGRADAFGVGYDPARAGAVAGP